MFLAFLAGTLSILSPCVLPLLPLTLGAAAAQGRYGPFALACWLTLSFVTASILAARGENLASVMLIMAAFGIGAALPLLILGSLSREFYQKWRGRMIGSGTVLKPVLGVILAVTGLMILTGFDKRVEARLVELSPAWLTELTTRY
ncbi:MAG: hypothetical protein NTU78_19520 [Alphaproteobacteria bacterium]|nr:hypothetical protein [Alphaproteobacteria bacterium]